VSDNETTYFRHALILGENVRNIAITGHGVVDGTGPSEAAEDDRHQALPARGHPRHHRAELAELLDQLLGHDFVDIDA